jgi:hypothetical protein
VCVVAISCNIEGLWGLEESSSLRGARPLVDEIHGLVLPKWRGGTRYGNGECRVDGREVTLFADRHFRR